VVEVQRTCEATATPFEEGANLSDYKLIKSDDDGKIRRTIRGFDDQNIESA